MYRGLQSAHYDLHAFVARSKLDRSYQDMLAGLSKPMTKFEAEIRFEEFASLVKMGHTRVDFPHEAWTQYLKNGGRVFPITIRVADNRVSSRRTEAV